MFQPESTVLCRAYARFCSSLPLHVECRPSDDRRRCAHTSSPAARNPQSGQKIPVHRESIWLPRPFIDYTPFACQFASGFFRISDKKFLLFQNLPVVFPAPAFALLHREDETFSPKVVSNCTKGVSGSQKDLGTQHFCALRGGSGLSYGVAYLRLKVSGSKSGSSQKRVMISV